MSKRLIFTKGFGIAPADGCNPLGQLQSPKLGLAKVHVLATNRLLFDNLSGFSQIIISVLLVSSFSPESCVMWVVGERRRWKRESRLEREEVPARVYFQSRGWILNWSWRSRWGNSSILMVSLWEAFPQCWQTVRIRLKAQNKHFHGWISVDVTLTVAVAPKDRSL